MNSVAKKSFSIRKFLRGNKHKCFLFVLTILVLVFAILAGEGKEITSYLIGGGVLGCISCSIVIIDIWFNKRQSAMVLLFWRSVADLGIAIRFLATYQLNLFVCNKMSCYINFDDDGLSAQGAAGCAFPSAFLEFFEIASEAWFFMIAMDLLESLYRPFSSFNSRTWKYHAFVWTVSLVFGGATFSKGVYGFWFVDQKVDNTAICWLSVKKSNEFNPLPLLLFYIPLVLVYTFAIGVFFFAYQRLRQGISQTIVHRMTALVSNSINILVYLIYWAVVGVFYIVSFGLPLNRSIVAQFFLKLFLYLIAAKGVFSLVIWIYTVQIHLGDDISAEDGDDAEQRVDLNGALRQEVLHFATKGIRHCSLYGVNFTPGTNQVILMEHVESKKGEALSIWFFIGLILGRRKECLEVAKLAKSAKQAAKRNANNLASDLEAPKARPSESFSVRLSERETIPFGHIAMKDFQPNQERNGGSDVNFGTRASKSTRVVSDGIRMSDIRIVQEADEGVASENPDAAARLRQFFGLERKFVEFTEFEPFHFRRVRKAGNVDDETYISFFQTTVKERLTEGGASGAFFFFSKDEAFIAKSCTEDEAAVLKNNAKQYADYLSDDPCGKNSCISKIYGAYMLKIYGTSLYFFVMNNLFLSVDGLTMHEKYDIKGSTVSRSAAPPREGQLATCTNCEQKFVYRRRKKKAAVTGSKSRVSRTESVFNEDKDDDRCNFTVSGEHEPSVILKDNDLKYKIRLPRPDARDLLKQLENDADFLLSIGVMDYSLLVGVHNTEYKVRGDDSERKSDDSTSSVPFQSTSNPLHAEGRTPVIIPRSSDDKAAQDFAAAQGQQTPPGGPSSEAAARAASPVNVAVDNRSRVGSVAIAQPDLDKQVLCVSRLEVERVVGPQAYQMGIIDFQQQWNLGKRIERFFKINFKGADPYGLSAIEPKTYRDRFVHKMEDILDLEDVQSRSVA